MVGTPPVGVGPTSLDVADLDGDEHADLVSVDRSGTVSTCSVTAAAVSRPSPLRRRLREPWTATADSDGDGREDSAVTMPSEARVGILFQPRPAHVD